jgi:hypothetical protein
VLLVLGILFLDLLPADFCSVLVIFTTHTPVQIFTIIDSRVVPTISTVIDKMVVGEAAPVHKHRAMEACGGCGGKV